MLLLSLASTAKLSGGIRPWILLVWFEAFLEKRSNTTIGTKAGNIANVRKWLRSLGIDSNQTRRWNRRADDQVDKDETADSEGTEANSEPADEIIALGPREDLGEYEKGEEEIKEEPDLNVKEEESAFHKRNLWSRSSDMGYIQDDEPMEDNMAANPRSAPAKTNGSSRGSPVASRSGFIVAESSARPRRSFQPPSRLVYDIPQSSIHRPEGPDEQVSASYYFSDLPELSVATESPIIGVYQCDSHAFLYSDLGGSEPSTPPVAPAGVNKRPAPSSQVNTFTSTNNFINQAAANISESLKAP
ncbi:hypothetical protein FBEOM_11775 [Fusarium beomiforme]|uniref:Uncharacterized protein n=1 Tax=Fusarium beomiforme TaxID=44412 RepID=A0A9P5A9A5_9HYPO|nr:hypothetical protein FBEOM_11775 [Fusarium beomiforme]